MSFVNDLATAVRTYHPSAQVWVSHQGWELSDVAAFYAYLKNVKPAWLTGVVYGPWTRDTLANSRSRIPAQYRLRRYPVHAHKRPDQVHVRIGGKGSTEDLLPALEMSWTYDAPASQVKVCLGFKDNPDAEVAYSIYVRLDLTNGKWFMGLERQPECAHDSPRVHRVAWSEFKLIRPGVEFQIPEDRIFSETLTMMAEVFNARPSKA
jgi:hypothetical protein